MKSNLIIKYIMNFNKFLNGGSEKKLSNSEKSEKYIPEILSNDKLLQLKISNKERKKQNQFLITQFIPTNFHKYKFLENRLNLNTAYSQNQKAFCNIQERKDINRPVSKILSNLTKK